MKHRWAIVGMLALALTACQRPVYVELHEVPPSGWAQDSVQTYRAEMTDTVQAYDVLITLRTDNHYPYQNIWLFLSMYRDSVLLVRDTIEGTLANERGEWLGKGNTYHDVRLLYDDGVRFDRAGAYTFTIEQGMRDEPLRGVVNVGMMITPTKTK